MVLQGSIMSCVFLTHMSYLTFQPAGDQSNAGHLHSVGEHLRHSRKDQSAMVRPVATGGTHRGQRSLFTNPVGDAYCVPLTAMVSLR